MQAADATVRYSILAAPTQRSSRASHGKRQDRRHDSERFDRPDALLLQEVGVWERKPGQEGAGERRKLRCSSGGQFLPGLRRHVREEEEAGVVGLCRLFGLVLELRRVLERAGTEHLHCREELQKVAANLQVVVVAVGANEKQELDGFRGRLL